MLAQLIRRHKATFVAPPVINSYFNFNSGSTWANVTSSDAYAGGMRIVPSTNVVLTSVDYYHNRTDTVSGLVVCIYNAAGQLLQVNGGNNMTGKTTQNIPITPITLQQGQAYWISIQCSGGYITQGTGFSIPRAVTSAAGSINLTADTFIYTPGGVNPVATWPINSSFKITTGVLAIKLYFHT